MFKSFKRFRLLPVVLLAVAHLIGLCLLLYWLMPRSQGEEKYAEGMLSIQVNEGRYSGRYVRIDGLSFSCRVQAVRSDTSCDTSYQKKDEVIFSKVTYFVYRPLEVHLGLVSSSPLVLLRIEQNGQVVYQRNIKELQKWFFITGSLIPLCLFGICFLLIIRLNIFNKEQ